MKARNMIQTMLVIGLLFISIFAIMGQNRFSIVRAQEAQLTGVIYDDGKDTDSNGKYDYLDATAEVNVQMQGKYRLEVYNLMDNYGYTIAVFSSSESYLNPGLQNITVSFYGPSIYASHRNAKSLYSVSLSMYPPFGGGTKYLDSLYGAQLSRVYNYTEFDCAANLTGTVYDQGIDTDHNGLIDELQIGVQVNVFENGTYMATVESLQGIGTYVSVYQSSTVFLTAGTQMINVSVSGSTIFSSLHELKGNVSSVTLQLFAEDNMHFYGIDRAGGAPLSKAYAYNEFQSPAYFTGGVFDNGVDEDGNGLYDYLRVGVEVNVTEAGTYKAWVSSLKGEKDGNLVTVYDWQSFEGFLNAQVHTINFTFSGPLIALSRITPTNISNVGIEDTASFSQLDHLSNLDLPTIYSYTQFDAPTKDMEADFTVFPDGTIEVGGKYNYTHMFPPNEGPIVNASMHLSTSGDLTTGSITGNIAPSETNEWPFNATTATFSSQYANGLLNASFGSTTFMPPEAGTTYPTNASNLSLTSTYLNGMLNVRMTGNTTIPSYGMIFPLNASDAVVLADYGGQILKGNITLHTVSGLPLGDVKVYFSGNKTDLYLTGNVTVIYGNYAGMEINATSLDQMLAEFNSTIPGELAGSLYNMTWNILECTQLNTVNTPIDSVGAQVSYSAKIHGNFTDFLARLVTEFANPPNKAELTRIFSAAIDSAFSSVQTGSLTITYYHTTGMAFIDAQFACDVQAFWSKAVEAVPPTVPVANRTQVEAWLKIANVTAHALEDFSFNASYSASSYELNLNLWFSANGSRLKNDVIPILPDAVPSHLREIVRSFTNSSYTELTSMNCVASFANGMGSFSVDWTLQGDFEAEANNVRRFYIDYLNATNPWMLGWEHEMLNATEININNFSMQLELSNESAYVAFSGLILHPVRDDIDFIRFTLHEWLTGMNVSGAPPQEFEKLKVVVTAGFNGTHTVLLETPGSTPSPDMVSLDYKTMMWQNVSISDLSDLLFKVAYQGVVNYSGQTYYVPIFTNSTVNDFKLNAAKKSLSFNVTGATGTGFCNVTVPRSLLYAAIGNWTLKIDGTTLSLADYNVTENDDYVFIYLNYTHSNHTIEIIGTWLVPEYPFQTLLSVLISLTLVATAIAAKRRRKPLAQ